YLSAYEKPAMALQHLEAYLGKERLDAAMQTYYQQWQFKHPQPQDFRQILENATGENLSWIFDGLFYSDAHLDYAISNLQEADNYKITVVNKGEIAAPFPVSGLINGEVVQTQWYQGFEGTQTLDFPKGNYDLIVIDATRVTLDINRKNNNIRPTGIFRKIEPLAFSFLPGAENELLTQAFWSPAAGWNNYDKLMLGAMIHNYGFPFKKFQFLAAPMYSFVNQDFTGVLDVQYYMYPRTGAQRITLGLTGRTFHYNRNTTLDYDLKYARLVPYINVELQKPPTSNFYQNVQWRTIWLNTESPQFDLEGKYLDNQWNDNFIHELSYTGENRRVLNPFSFGVMLEQQSYQGFNVNKENYLKASLEWNSSFTYAEKKNFSLRVFGGFFIENTRRNAGGIFPGAFNLTSQGFNDYRFDDYYFGRTDFEGPWSRQVTMREGGMKNVIGGGFNLGRSNNYIIALNLKSDLPIRLPLNLPLKPYFDLGYFDNAQPTGTNDTFKDQLLWSGGIMLEVIDKAFAIYFPLVNSKNIQDRYIERGNYWQRVSFTLDFKLLNPLRWAERIDF
ncbi:MAG: M1 family aminopeptidase, partial [Saprospiraceae bacterium]